MAYKDAVVLIPGRAIRNEAIFLAHRNEKQIQNNGAQSQF
jgi:hypothetical protein